MLLPQNSRALETGIKQRTVGIAAYAFPCNTWSRARRGKGGPPPLRRDNPLEILGVDRDSLCEGDRAKLDSANKLFFWLLRILRLHIKHNVPFILENPRLSLLWKAGPIGPILKHCDLCDVDFCMFGTPWRKPTKLAVFNLPEINDEMKVCHRRGWCERTGKRHIILEGKDPQGVFWTARAAPYPRKFCQALARVIVSRLRHERSIRVV